MKKAFIYILVGVLGFSACSLEEDPKYTLNTQTVFSSSETVNAVIFRGYSHLADIELYGRLLWAPTVGNGVTVGTAGGDALTRAAQYNVDPTDQVWLLPAWRRVYKVVAEANYLLDGLNRSGLSEEYKTFAQGHAYFLRGYSYYLIASLWGGAPLFVDPVTSDNLHLGKSPRKDLYAQAEQDLLQAAQSLRTDYVLVTGGGIANKYTAYAYLAKLNFMLASQVDAGLSDDLLSSDEASSTLWAKAKQYGDSVVNSNLYALESDFSTLFTSHLSGSQESIFQLNYTTGDGVQKRWNQLFGPVNYVAGSPSFRNIRIDKAFYDFHVGTHGETDARVAATYLTQFTNLNNVIQTGYPYRYRQADRTYLNIRDYRTTTSDPKNPEYVFDTVSTATASGQAMPVLLYNFWTNDVTNGAQGNFANSYSAKAADKNSVAQFDSRNTILFRYADLLLLLADAENELGNLTTARAYVQQVLDRAGVTTAVPSTKDDLREFIFFERMFELAGEPVLYEDIRRRGTSYLQKVLEIHNNHWLTKYRVQLQTARGTRNQFDDYLINGGNSSDASFLRRALLLPIPKDELDNNERLSASDQNYGY